MNHFKRSFLIHFRLSLAILLIVIGLLLSTNPVVLALVGGRAIGGGPQSNAGFAVRQSASVNNGLAAYYPLDGNANDVSGNGNNGKLNNFTFDNITNGWAKGKFGNALKFDGVSDYATAGSLVNPAPDTFTLSAWFMTTLAGGSIMGFGETSGANDNYYDRLIFVNTSGKISFVTAPAFVLHVITSPLSYNNGKWHFVTVTLSPSGQTLYVDGALVAFNSGYISGFSYGSGGYWKIGTLNNSFSGGGSKYFNGSIDDVRIYNRALSAAEVTTLYQGSSPEQCDQYCMGWWRLDGTSGTTEDSQYAYDYGPHGTVAGQYGNALKLTGGDIGTASKTTVNPTTFSYSAWFKTSSNGNIISFSNNTYGRHLYVGDDGKVYYTNVDFGSTANQLVSTSTYNDNAWHHVVLSLSGGSTGTLYVDGAQVATSSSLGTPAVGTSAWIIGEGNFFLGGIYKNYVMTLDDVRVYNVALIASDVTTLYTAVTPPVCTTQCYAYWPLDDTSGSTGTDSSGNSNSLGLSSRLAGASFSFPYLTTNRPINRATLTNVTFGTNSTSGVFGNALTLNGSTSSIISSSLLNNDNAAEYTQELWFNTTSNTTQTIMKLSNGTDYRVILMTPSGQISVLSYVPTTAASGYNDGNWHHLAITDSKSGVSTKIYVDGVLVGSSAFYEPIQAHSQLYVGQHWGGFSNFSGSIDDIREYSRVLADYEIYDQYVSGR